MSFSADFIYMNGYFARSSANPLSPVPERIRGLTSRAVPIVLQHERAECGLACLAMVAGYFGRTPDLDSLRQYRPDSGQGATFQGLLDVAENLQLIARPLRLSLQELPQLQLPAVLHWRINHFVVLTKLKRRQFTIHDPATGKRTVGLVEMDESFSGVALEFAPSTKFKPRKESRRLTFLDFVSRFRHLYRYLTLMLVLLVTIQILGLVPAIATQILIDEVVLGQDRIWLYRALGGLAIVMLVAVMLEAMRSWIGIYTGTRLAVDSSVGILAHVMNLPVMFVRRRHLGDLMSKLESLTPIRQALTEHTANGFVQLIVLITTLTIMFLYSTWLTAVSVAGLTASILLMVALLPRSRRLSEESLIHHAAKNSSLVETLRGFETVQSLGLSSVRRLHWQRHFLRATAAEVSLGKMSVLRRTATALINVVEQVLFLAVGISGILDREITLGVLFAFMGLRARFSGAAIGLTETVQTLSLLKVHTGRLSDLALAAPVSPGPAGALKATLNGALEARELCFAYSHEQWIVKNVNCRIVPGAHAVVTGPSGCGKTTLLKLLAGQLESLSGQTMIDGVDISMWDPGALRRQTGMVLQGENLFQGTITENISGFASVPDLALIRAASTIAEIWTDIQSLPMKTETLIGDTGTGLSGGQVQRMALARALYRKPKVLFLDEATSHLDVDTEKRVLQNIARLNITIVSVAHRPEAIGLASQVIALNGQ